MKNLIKNPVDGYKFICIPFVDFDGVICGDQEKQRIPHDHNRDYVKDDAPIYAETKKIREITPDAFKYFTKNALYVGRSWNTGGNHSFSSYVINNPDERLAFTLETPYFGTKDKSNVFTEKSGIALGNSFANAFKKYIKSRD